MSDAISSVLSQIRSMQTRLNPGVDVVKSDAVAETSGGFAKAMGNALQRVNENQLESSQLQASYEKGDANVDLVRVMLASQQAQIGFRATVEVRNRLVQAYQEVMNMPL